MGNNYEHAPVNRPFLYKTANRAVFGAYFRLQGGISYCGSDNLASIDRMGSYLLAVKHSAFIDPAIIANTLLKANGSQAHFLAKKELWYEWPDVADIASKIVGKSTGQKIGNAFAQRVAGPFLDRTGAFPVDRKIGMTPELEEIIDELVQKNAIITFFAEGTRVAGNKVGKIQTGVGAIAIKDGIPIVPVGIAGAEKKDRGPIHVEYIQPIFTQKLPSDVTRREKYSRIRSVVARVQNNMQEAQDLAVEHRNALIRR